MKKLLIILLFIPLVCRAETLSESIATLIVKGIEFYSENKTTIDSVYQEVKPILTAAPEERKQLIIKTLKSQNYHFYIIYLNAFGVAYDRFFQLFYFQRIKFSSFSLHIFLHFLCLAH